MILFPMKFCYVFYVSIFIPHSGIVGSCKKMRILVIKMLSILALTLTLETPSAVQLYRSQIFSFAGGHTSVGG